tara:strand:+ start:2261 stop:2683 length:423 start_codon:yes stop_codon:yes gene_type:complete
MPTDFNNIIFDEIMENLATIINGEFSIGIHYDEHKGNQSFLLIPESDTLLEHLSSGISREYSISVEYQVKSGGTYNKNSFKQVSNIMERFKRLVFNNISYSNGTSWFDGRITDIDYSKDEDDDTLLKGVATFVCNNIEII